MRFVLPIMTACRPGGSTVLAVLLISSLAGCDPCRKLDAAPLPPGPARPEVRVAVTLDGISSLVSAELLRARTRGTRRVHRAVQPDEVAVVATGQPGSVTIVAAEDLGCPSCVVVRGLRPVDLAIVRGPAAQGAPEPVGRVYVPVEVRLDLEVRPGGGSGLLEVAPKGGLAVSPQTSPPDAIPGGIDAALAPAASRIAQDVARLDVLDLARRLVLLRLRPWPARSPDLAISEVVVRVPGRLLLLEGAPGRVLPGKGLEGVEVEPAIGQDATWGISGALLAALASDPEGAPAFDLLGAAHQVGVRSFEAQREGLGVLVRARRREGCGWVDLSADPLRPTTSRGRPALLGPERVGVVDSGGLDRDAAADEEDARSVALYAKGRIEDRLAQFQVLGPQGQELQPLLLRRAREQPALLLDGAFNRPRPPARPPRPVPPTPGLDGSTGGPPAGGQATGEAVPAPVPAAPRPAEAPRPAAPR